MDFENPVRFPKYFEKAKRQFELWATVLVNKLYKNIIRIICVDLHTY